MTTSDIKAIIQNGANIKISASKTTSDLKSIAREAKAKNLKVTISGAREKNISDLKAIVKEYPYGVTLELD